MNAARECIGALLAMLAGVLKGDGPHRHRCGFDKRKSDGCGHEWKHDAADCESEEEFERSHLCPKCGRGPWKLHVNPKTEEALTQLRSVGK